MSRMGRAKNGRPLHKSTTNTARVGETILKDAPSGEKDTLKASIDLTMA